MLAGGVNVSHVKLTRNINLNLKKILKIFLYKTSEINNSALDILINKGGIVDRVFGFKRNALEVYIKNCVYSFNAMDIIPNDDKVNIINTPFNRDALKFWNVIGDFVENFINEIQPVYNIHDLLNDINIPGLIKYDLSDVENLKKLLTFHIFVVSFWHEHIGNMSMYVLNPKLIKTKVHYNYPCSEFDSKQNTMQNIHLALVTSIISMPKITDQLNSKSDAFIKLKDNLNNIKMECMHLSPELLECSISL